MLFNCYTERCWKNFKPILYIKLISNLLSQIFLMVQEVHTWHNTHTSLIPKTLVSDIFLRSKYLKKFKEIQFPDSM